MITTVLALTFMAPLPSQGNVPPLLNGYNAQQRQLSDLHYALLLQRNAAEDNAQKWTALWNAAHQRGESLTTLLSIQRQFIQVTDKSCIAMADTTRRWERARQQTPGPIAPGVFHADHRSIFHARAGARQFCYCVFLNHRWSWEGEDSMVNTDCAKGLARLLGYKADYDVMLLHLGWTEAALTDLWPFLRW